MNPQVEKQKVSIIVPTHNSAQTLSWCLQSVKNQTYDYCEVIVVDDLSSDETIGIAENFGVKILQRTCNPAKARNLGVASSTGEYVLFLDSDQILSPSVIEECVDKCVKEKAEMIRIPEVFVGKGFWSVCSAVWKNRYEKVEYLYGTRMNLIHGEPRFFVRTRIEDIGMFDTMLVWGEDYDLYERLKSINIKEAYCTSVLYHREVVSLRQLSIKNLRYGKSVPVFLHQTNRQVFPSMLSHALLTFTQILKEPQRPTVVAGCALLLWIKSHSMIIGVLRGLWHQVSSNTHSKSTATTQPLGQ
ncbi:glycosyltransferase family 2 protein [Candidatus Bathyarchaeota archaeon]|nr:glycosyltransferase family 2 protein [Candidatus Bathyarchaeota archaeon]